jgi:hypothetical protein
LEKEVVLLLKLSPLRTDKVDLGLGVGVIQRGVRAGRTRIRHAKQAAPSLVHKQGFRDFWVIPRQGFHFFFFLLRYLRGILPKCDE